MRRSVPFADLERDCRRAGKELAETYAFWFRRTYSLAPTDPRFLDATPEQIITDYWAHHHHQRKAAGRPEEEEFEDESFDHDEVLNLEAMPEDWIPVIDDQGSGHVPGN